MNSISRLLMFMEFCAFVNVIKEMESEFHLHCNKCSTLDIVAVLQIIATLKISQEYTNIYIYI